MSATCQPPWHFRLNTDGRIYWFRPLSPIKPSPFHYRIGSVPEDSETRRIYGFSPDDELLTCEGCGRVIGFEPPQPPQVSEPPEPQRSMGSAIMPIHRLIRKIRARRRHPHITG